MSKQSHGEREVRTSGPPVREGQQSAGASERTADDHLIRGYD